jgi:UDP-3-O-[3-hydroxymyristoyl] glucosamine N-acyltransferase
VEIRNGDGIPSVAPDAYVAPTAVLSGRVRIGPGTCVLHGAVLTDDGGPVNAGASCVIMEHAVLRGTPRHPLTIGDHVLAGPHSYLTGATIGDEVFIATGAMVFNGAHVGQASSIRAGLDEAGGFLPFVFGADPAADRRQQMRVAMHRYASYLSRRHSNDEQIHQTRHQAES